MADKKREKCRIDHDGWLDLFVLDILSKLEGAGHAWAACIDGEGGVGGVGEESVTLTMAGWGS